MGADLATVQSSGCQSWGCRWDGVGSLGGVLANSLHKVLSRERTLSRELRASAAEQSRETGPGAEGKNDSGGRVGSSIR